jgi:hypothetical protein
MFLKQIKWRQENNMETIQDEDWSDMEQDYGMRVEGNDKEGRPGIQIYSFKII